jgi:predicted nucleic acid-binding protein
MKPIFLDTVGLIALWNADDQWHQLAAEALERIIHFQNDFVTTSAILLECGNAAARQPFRHEVDLLRLKFEVGKRVIFPTDEDWQNAWQAYRAGEADQAGIVDCLSFTIMHRLDLNQAFTHDHHFQAAGFETLF